MTLWCLFFVIMTSSAEKARAFNVEAQPVAPHIADGRAACTARAFGPAAIDLVLAVDREFAAEIEIVAVAGAAQLKIDFVRGASSCGSWHYSGYVRLRHSRASAFQRRSVARPEIRQRGRPRQKPAVGGMAIAATKAQAGMAIRASACKIRVRKGRFPFKVGVELPDWGPPALKQMGWFRFRSRMPVCRLQNQAAILRRIRGLLRGSVSPSRRPGSQTRIPHPPTSFRPAERL